MPKINHVTFDPFHTTEFSINTIGTINLVVGEKHDMTQYIVDPENRRTSTSMNNLGASASYDRALEELTALTEDTLSTAELEMTDE